jgi:hypothetical protein
MMTEWPLGFDDELVDEEHSFAASLAKPRHPSTHSRALSGAMKECKHQLPTSQCTWCNGKGDTILPDPAWDLKDYAQREFTETSGNVGTDAHDVTPEVAVGTVHPREIYGLQLAARIKTVQRST